MAVEGGTTNTIFEAYVERVMAPSLSPGQVVMIDNLSAHEGERVRQLVEQRGAELMFLPSSCSPDFSPIEESFSKLKVVLRRSKARTKEALAEATGLSLVAVTVEDARDWFSIETLLFRWVSVCCTRSMPCFKST